ncbi:MULTISPECIES: Rsd/AlgQ family anti-sigma factor [Pseudoalteromonas]|uniref:Anti-RNA polymerase sigma 70 factor n=1 Tax=Pseudoalteromonas amylolytica TaxID=1859457 RepID=A0A1S1MM49_9GAMM|nr:MULTISPECIES: Rsd/AlgQ family anti-sigma factor [Pseudoalteromonas]MCF6437543.1 Rsd/AlgQ family anti-sigma factor [Pseudoalteromonas sp. MMG022]OHU85980.1 anti-RNA polymerase sigma 70 factor [Pseudoalteromonas sp. JW3]OHU89410.1 anti-RNA polymerase sigma 70 factor [Pseudoalteromonas amylolytica]
MLSRLEQAQEKWGGSHSVIDAWLAERQELLLQYCKIAGFSPYDKKDHALPDQLQIQSFCQILMDYLSAGHFEIYDNLVEACEEKGPDSAKLAQALYPRIADTTDVALDFNDKYAENSQEQVLRDFDRDLSNLGEVLELRFELEDELIDNLYANHTD